MEQGFGYRTMTERKGTPVLCESAVCNGVSHYSGLALLRVCISLCLGSCRGEAIGSQPLWDYSVFNEGEYPTSLYFSPTLLVHFKFSAYSKLTAPSLISYILYESNGARDRWTRWYDQGCVTNGTWHWSVQLSWEVGSQPTFSVLCTVTSECSFNTDITY